jgi:serine/threonine protein kinase
MTPPTDPSSSDDSGLNPAEWDEVDDSESSCRRESLGRNAALSSVRRVISPREEIVLGPIIGRGSFGVVYKGSWKGQIVAVKELFDATVHEEEAAILSVLSHRNVVGYRCESVTAEQRLLVTEFVPNGTVYEVLKFGKLHLTYARLVNWLMQIAEGMNYLHCGAPLTVGASLAWAYAVCCLSYPIATRCDGSKRPLRYLQIMHRDLKSHNILCDLSANCLKIADFNTAKATSASTAKGTRVGTVCWMAPEVLRNEPYSRKVGLCALHARPYGAARSTEPFLVKQADVWSYGVCMWELLTGCVPFDGMESNQAITLLEARAVQPVARPTRTYRWPSAFGEGSSSCRSQKRVTLG